MQNEKNKYLAALLAYTFGGFGAHRFYLGQTGKGLLYLLFFWTLIPSVIAFFETFYFLFLSDDEFNRRYNGARLLPPGKTPHALPAPQPALNQPGHYSSTQSPQRVAPYPSTSTSSVAYDSVRTTPQGADGSVATPSSHHYSEPRTSNYSPQQPTDIAYIRANLDDLERRHREGMISHDEYFREKDRLWNQLTALNR